MLSGAERSFKQARKRYFDRQLTSKADIRYSAQTAWSDIRVLLISINTNMKHAETSNDEILVVRNVDLVGADRPSPPGGLAGGNKAEVVYYRSHKMLRNVTPPVTPRLERCIFLLVTL